MNKEELNQWYMLLQQVKNGYHMSKFDKQELIRLNHLVMTEANKVHNDHVLDKEW